MGNKNYSNGLDLPEGYFEEFEDRLFHKLSEDKLPKEAGFSVPKNYFNNLEERLNNYDYATKKEVNVITLITKKTLLYAASIAAIAILVFSIINTNNNSITINDLDFASIENYIEDGNMEVNINDISSLLNDDVLLNFTDENIIIPELQIEEYLLENIEDTSILIE